MPATRLQLGPAPPPSAQLNIATLRKVIVAAKNGSAADAYGWSGELLIHILKDETALKLFAALIQDVVDGQLTHESRHLIQAAALLAIRKGDKVRPIASSSLFYKIAAGYVMTHTKPLLKEYFGDLQVAVGAEGGPEKAAHVIQHCIMEGEEKKHLTFKCDIAAAYQNLDRQKMFSALEKLGSNPLVPILSPLTRWSYKDPSLLLTSSGPAYTQRFDGFLLSTTGVKQGCRLATALFCLTIHPVLKAVQRKHPSVRVIAVADDITLIGPREDILTAVTTLADGLANLSLTISPTKSHFVDHHHPQHRNRTCPHVGAILDAGWRIEYTKTAAIAGACLGTCDEERSAWYSQRVAEHDALFDALGNAAFTNSPQAGTQTAFLILLYCAAPKLNFILRTAPPQVIDQAAKAFQAKVQQALASLLHLDGASLTDAMRAQAALPPKLGGLGLVDPSRISPAAYSAAVISCREALKAYTCEQNRNAMDRTSTGRLLTSAIDTFNEHAGDGKLDANDKTAFEIATGMKPADV